MRHLLVTMTLLVSLAGCSQPEPTPTPAAVATPAATPEPAAVVETPTPVAVVETPAPEPPRPRKGKVFAPVSLIDEATGQKFVPGPDSKGKNLTLRIEPHKRIGLTTLWVGFDAKHHVATPFLPSYQAGGGVIEHLTAEPGVQLYVVCMEENGPDATAMSDLFDRCQKEIAATPPTAAPTGVGPAQKALYARLNEWSGETTFGTAQAGALVRETGGTRSQAAQNAGARPLRGEATADDSELEGKKAEVPAPAGAVAGKEVDWRSTADMVPYGPEAHGVIIYPLSRKK